MGQGLRKRFEGLRLWGLRAHEKNAVQELFGLSRLSYKSSLQEI